MKKKIQKVTLKYTKLLKRKARRAYGYVVYNSKQSRLVRKYARMEARKAVLIFASGVRFQVKTRPRIKLVSIAILILALTLIGSNRTSAYIKSREAEVKVNGHSVLVAEKTEEIVVPEIEAGVTYKRSPFDFKYPVDGQISQGFRNFHRAYDIAAPYNSVIKPLGTGKVEFAGTVSDGHGRMVVVDHGDGLKSSYAHMNQILVGVGDEVNGDTEIGTIGLTGRTTGAHVHLEVYDNGIAINPGDLLPDR